MRIHILGICGTFMGGLAMLARSLGHEVTGSDANVYPPMSTLLEKQGIDLIQGYDASQLDVEPDLVIIGNAMTRGNPCVEAVLEKMKKQIKECQDYDAKLGHLALDQIHLDLDDGVKINYRKVQTGRDGKFYEVLADSKNIMAKDALWHEYLTEWYHEQ